jgi:hypothetical protein
MDEIRPCAPGASFHLGMRAADADRERAVDVLRAGFAEGRLGKREYARRAGAAPGGADLRRAGGAHDGPARGAGAGCAPARWHEPDRGAGPEVIDVRVLPRDETFALPDIIRSATNLVLPEVKDVRIAD